MSTTALELNQIEANPRAASQAHATANAVTIAGQHAMRYGLVLLLVWMGGMKFTAYEAEGISGLVSSSPLMSWAYNIFSARQFSALLGLTELLIAGLITARPLWPAISALGSALAAAMFLVTLSFMATTPGVIEPSLGLPALSVLPGQLLVKDIVLLAVAVWALGESLGAIPKERRRTN